MKACLQIKPMYCSREYNFTSRFNQQYEKSTSNLISLLCKLIKKEPQLYELLFATSFNLICLHSYGLVKEVNFGNASSALFIDQRA